MPGSPLEVDTDVNFSASCDPLSQQESPSTYETEGNCGDTEQGDDSGTETIVL